MKKQQTISLSLLLLLAGIFLSGVFFFRSNLRSTADIVTGGDNVLAGQAIQEDGKPVVGYALLSGGQRDGDVVKINKNGQFFFSGLPNGDYSVDIVGGDQKPYTNNILESNTVAIGNGQPNFISLSHLKPSASPPAPPPATPTPPPATPPPAPTVTCKVPSSILSAVVACYNEGSGTTVPDGSGHGNDGILSGNAKWDTVGCKVNACLTFGGTDGKVTVDNPSLDLNEKTIAAWIRTDKTGLQWFVRKPNAAANNLNYYLFSNYCCLGSNALGDISFQTKSWMYVVVTEKVAADGAAMYINGQLVKSGSIASFNHFPGPLTIGELMLGAMDEITFFNRALTAPEAQALYQAAQ